MKTDWIDQNVLNELCALQPEGEPDFVSEVINSYLDSATGHLERLSSFTTSANSKTIAREAHSLKSSSLSLGALEVGKLCEELEALSDQDNPDSSQRTARLLLDALKKTCAELKALKKERDSDSTLLPLRSAS